MDTRSNATPGCSQHILAQRHGQQVGKDAPERPSLIQMQVSYLVQQKSD